jgi:hypothetical protein
MVTRGFWVAVGSSPAAAARQALVIAIEQNAAKVANFKVVCATITGSPSRKGCDD